MIARGTALSRFLAVLLAASPLLIAGGAFTSWAVGRWIEGGRALAAAEQRRHEAEALTSQATLFAPLGEAWRGYAETAQSGLAQEPTAAETAHAFALRLRTAFADAGGALRGIERLEPGPPPRPGLQSVRFEAHGLAPQAQAPALLAAIEGETPYAFIEFLDAQAAEGAGGGAEASLLALRLRLAVYRLTDPQLTDPATQPALEGGPL